MAPATHVDRWNGEHFTCQEIDQLVLVASELSSGRAGIDARRLSPKVRRWLVRWNYCKRTDKGFMFTDLLAGVRCDSWMPLEALWRVVSPMLGEARSVGHSICRNPGWRAMNLFTSDQRLFSSRDEDAMLDTLLYLSSHGYLDVQVAGSLWEVSERKDRRL